MRTTQYVVRVGRLLSVCFEAIAISQVVEKKVLPYFNNLRPLPVISTPPL